MKILYIHLITSFIFFGLPAQINFFHQIYPLNSFKLVIDTCVRSYSDALVLQEQAASGERIDELLDMLIGRLMRLQSYIDQLIYAYKYEATVSIDELEYLMQMIDYLDITVHQNVDTQINTGLNAITSKLKIDLKQAITKTSFFIPMLRLPCLSLPSTNRLLLFA